MRIEQLADIQLAFPNFTEARDLGTQKLVRDMGVARMPQARAVHQPAPG